jgi:hypothetical protein
MSNIKAIIEGTPLSFYISSDFAKICIQKVGGKVNHPCLGKLFCHEVIMEDDIYVVVSKKLFF